MTKTSPKHSPCSLRRWNRGDPSKLFLKELSRVLQWAELLAARPLPPPGLEGGVNDKEPTPPPSAREEDEDEEEEGGVEERWWGWWTGVPRGVGNGEPWGVTCSTEWAEFGYKLLVTDFRTEDEGKKKREMGDRSGEGEGEREDGLCRGRDLMGCRWGRSAGPLVGRVWVFGLGAALGLSWARAERGAVALPCLGSLVCVVAVVEVTSDWLKVNTGLW